MDIANGIGSFYYGVGVDGVRGIFPFFRFSAFFLCFSSLFLLLVRFSPVLLGQEQTTAIYWENGEFHSDPVCTDPVQNFPMLGLWEAAEPRVHSGVRRRVVSKR